MPTMLGPAVITQSMQTSPSISTFLTNLHLLDLDRHEDWPRIDAQIFTRKNTLQNEKSRIHCVEWALYQLFYIWDLEQTKNVRIVACVGPMLTS